MAGRVSQVATEVIADNPDAKARVSTVAVEALVAYSDAPAVRVSQIAVEVLLPYVHPTWTANVQVVSAGMG